MARFTRIFGLGVMGLSLVLGASLGGCENNKTKEAAAQLESENAELRTQNAGLQEQLRSRDSQIASLQSQISSAQNPAPAAGGQPGNGGGSMAMNPDDFGGIEGVQSSRQGSDIVLDVAGSVLFASGSDQLSTTAKRSLDRVASVLSSKYRSNSIRVEGHTDSDPIRKSKFADNYALSEARARSVANYLSSKGVSRSKIESVGYGADRPKGSKSASRRVEIVILGR